MKVNFLLALILSWGNLLFAEDIIIPKPIGTRFYFNSVSRMSFANNWGAGMKLGNSYYPSTTPGVSISFTGQVQYDSDETHSSSVSGSLVFPFLVRDMSERCVRQLEHFMASSMLQADFNTLFTNAKLASPVFQNIFVLHLRAGIADAGKNNSNAGLLNFGGDNVDSCDIMRSILIK